MACNVSTPPRVLDDLAGDACERVRLCAAANASLPPQTLAALSRDASYRVRAAAAAALDKEPRARRREARENNNAQKEGAT